MSGRIVTAVSYALPILAGMTLGVIFREPVLVLLGIVVAVGVDISRRIAASRPKAEPGGRFKDGRWIDMPPEPPFRLGHGSDDALTYMAVDAVLSAAEEVAPKVQRALEERARERKT